MAAAGLADNEVKTFGSRKRARRPKVWIAPGHWRFLARVAPMTSNRRRNILKTALTSDMYGTPWWPAVV